jgi:hypothetical protein
MLASPVRSNSHPDIRHRKPANSHRSPEQLAPHTVLRCWVSLYASNLKSTPSLGVRVADCVFLDYSYNASQADVAAYKALSSAPDAAKYPNAARWYKHIASYEDEFSTLSGDASKPYTAYGPEVAEVTLNPAKAPAAAEEDEDDVDLFGSDEDEEEDVEAAKLREERLAEYRKKKEAKGPKPAAKSIVTMDIKPWGTFHTIFHASSHETPVFRSGHTRHLEDVKQADMLTVTSLQMTRPT